MDKVSQRMRILQYMREHGGRITSIEGQSALKIVDTRKRISELRKLGAIISDRWETSEGPHGKTRYKVYKLEEEQTSIFGGGDGRN